jgi:hypothetical protein
MNEQPTLQTITRQLKRLRNEIQSCGSNARLMQLEADVHALMDDVDTLVADMKYADCGSHDQG